VGLRIGSSGVIENNIEKARRDSQSSLEKLSSGVRFTRQDPMPAERSLSDSLSSKLRELSSYKRNANDGISLVQSADSALNEISNITVRLKELATQASSAALSDKERSFLFVEYQSLYEEINRIAKTTEFNGMALLSGQGTGELSFRVGRESLDQQGSDRSLVKISQLSEINASSETLGLVSVPDLANTAEGVSLDDVIDTFSSSDQSVGESFEQALEKLALFRSTFGSVGARLSRVMDVIDTSIENTSAANSRLKDVDYASEIANLTKANILLQAGTSLLSQGNLPAALALTLVKNLDKG
jgi:flagellin